MVGEEGAGRGDDGLAGTDIALEQAAHGGGLAEVGGGFVDGPALGLGELEGEAIREGREVLVWEGQGGFALAAGAEVGQAQVETEELLEHQAAAGRLQVRPGGGKVDGPVGLGGVDQAMLRPEGGGKGVFDLVQAGGEGSAEKGDQKVLGDPGGAGIDGGDAAGEFSFALRLKAGVGHLAVEADASDLTVEDVSLAGVEGVADVALVEKGQVELAGVVHGAALGDLHAGTEVAGAERLGDEGGDGSGGVGGEDGDAFPEGAVLVVPGEVGQQVGGGVETQLGQGGGAGGADAVKFCEGGVQGDGWFGHGRSLLSGGCRFIVAYGAEKRKNFSEVARFHATWRGVEGKECKEV